MLLQVLYYCKDELFNVNSEPDLALIYLFMCLISFF